MSSSEEEELIENESDGERNLEIPHTATNWTGQNSNREVVEDKKEISKTPSKSIRTIPNIMHKDLTFEERCD